MLNQNQKIKAKIFDALILSGEVPDRIDRNLVIFISEIKVTKKRTNAYDLVTVEDICRDDYYEINNKFILEAILKKICHDIRCKQTKGSTELHKSMEEQ